MPLTLKIYNTMRRFIIVCLLLCSSYMAVAQESIEPIRRSTNDFRGRVEAAFEFEPIKNLSLEAGVQLRLKDDFASVDRIQTSVGAEYEVCDYFSLGADYVLINGRDDSRWDKPRHRVNANLVGSVKIGRVELSLRERLQTTFRTDSVNIYEKPKNEMILRSRLMAEYSIRHSRWTPYVLFELHNTLNAPGVVSNYKSDPYCTDNYVTRYRAGIGAKLRITRSHRLDFYYYFDYDRGYDIDYKGNKGDLKGYVQENEIRHIIGISYKFKL